MRRLRETHATSDIPVIVLTGRHEQQIEQQMRNMGVNDFLTKPFDWNRLRSAIDLCLTS